ncbi:hypothetical protein J437_LFUL002658 [Ladona fulva]|uniref:DDE-1 domain-containing protein n=1 Tax=Ladona fulva TaxID=123851 RepID=A0A8K0JYC5_LADFU|nr:hypothetical protein J437_LFUL002658 [Ladona fulva]
MKECQQTMRKPDSISVARLMAFNKFSVGNFFEVLRELRSKHQFHSKDIYNIDDTGFSTVPTKSPKVISARGNQRVIKATSAERGTTITCVCAMNAIGNFFPFLIFPRMRMNPSFIYGAPNGSTEVARETGWITAQIFLKYLQHFKLRSFYYLTTTALIQLGVDFYRAHNIFLLVFPPHTSHKLQPLDVAFYSPLTAAYSQGCDNFMVNHPGYAIAIKTVAGIFGKAYLKTAIIRIAINEPFNYSIFDDEDFEPSHPTDTLVQDSQPKDSPAVIPDPSRDNSA